MKAEWEYRVEVLGGILSGPKVAELESLLNEVSADGWEYVDLTLRGNNQLWVILRRARKRRERARTRSWP